MRVRVPPEAPIFSPRAGLSISTRMSETHSRTLARTISYRITALLITAIWTGLSDAVVIHIALATLHYAMERIWLKIHWGKL